MNQHVDKFTKIFYGVIVATLAYSTFALLFQFFTNNVYSPFASEELIQVRDPILDAFVVQKAGYHLAILIVAVIAFAKKRADSIFLISLWVLISNLFDLSISLFHGIFSFQSITMSLVIFLSGYCAYKTRHAIN